ncbi:MAG: hypothetical protein HDQ88_04880 [Clostridia bacterium]|nr:hypothetical protein [Clostridia bacterium]
MTFLCFLFIRKEYKGTIKLSKNVINHEGIHSIQQIELLIADIIICSILCWTLGLSWWWLLVGILFPVILYILCWLIEILLPPYDHAYGNICFESEAIYNEYDFNYIKYRLKHPFRWLKYIPNKKYPYLNNYQRRKLHVK